MKPLGPQSQRRPGVTAACRRRFGAWRAWLVIVLSFTILAACSSVSEAVRPTPIANRPISLNGHCAQIEDDGFRENAVLQVRNNEVQALTWELWVGKRGSCKFEQSEFRQTKRSPHIELLARDGGGCKLMIWQDKRRITLAHAGCERRCTAGVYDQAWPVMFDPGTGACAQNAR